MGREKILLAALGVAATFGPGISKQFRIEQKAKHRNMGVVKLP